MSMVYECISNEHKMFQSNFKKKEVKLWLLSKQ
jgi:hypothetical protein